jgi:hypothetical protein
MDFAFIWNLLNLAGFLLSIYAAWTAVSAKKAAKYATSAVIRRSNQAEDRSRHKALTSVLSLAKDAATRRQRGAHRSMSAGHDKGNDERSLRRAHDALITELPLDASDDLKIEAEKTSIVIGESLKFISEGSTDRDGWLEALRAIQSFLPQLAQEERRRQNQELEEIGTARASV